MNTIDELVLESFEIAKAHGFWEYPYDLGKPKPASGFEDAYSAPNPLGVPTKLWLAAGELVEAGIIHHKTDLSIPENFNAFMEEVADVFIRLFDLCGYLYNFHNRDVDFGSIIAAKMEKNKKRPYKHGKNY